MLHGVQVEGRPRRAREEEEQGEDEGHWPRAHFEEPDDGQAGEDDYVAAEHAAYRAAAEARQALADMTIVKPKRRWQ